MGRNSIIFVLFVLPFGPISSSWFRLSQHTKHDFPLPCSTAVCLWRATSCSSWTGRPDRCSFGNGAFLRFVGALLGSELSDLWSSFHCLNRYVERRLAPNGRLSVGSGFDWNRITTILYRIQGLIIIIIHLHQLVQLKKHGNFELIDRLAEWTVCARLLEDSIVD